MKWLFSSNFPMKGNEKVAERIIEQKGQRKILYIGYSPSAAKYSSIVKSYGLDSPDFLDLSKTHRPGSYEDYAVYIFHGGNPFSIRKCLQDSGWDKIIPKLNGLIVTVSGSTCLFSLSFTLIRSFYPSWKGDDTQGYGFFPQRIIPHGERYKKYKSKFEEYGKSKDFYVINDGGGILFVDKKITKIGSVLSYPDE